MPSILCSLDHIATTQQLARHGVSAYALRRAVYDGRVTRIRRGIYACTHIDSDTARAARANGAVSCVSALRRAGVWAGHSDQLHVHVSPTESGLARERDPEIRYHWARPRFGMVNRFTPTRTEALWLAIHCLDGENAVAAMESAIHEQFLSVAEVRRIAALAPRRLQPEIRHMVTNSGSGNETIVRLRLLNVGYRVESQGHVPGMGHEDLVVEDCVGLDVDGRAWHGEDRFAIDRDRDLRVEGFGRRALRIRAAHIFETWPNTLAVIDRAVKDARREQARRTGRVLVRRDDPL